MVLGSFACCCGCWRIAGLWGGGCASGANADLVHRGFLVLCRWASAASVSAVATAENRDVLIATPLIRRTSGGETTYVCISV